MSSLNSGFAYGTISAFSPTPLKNLMSITNITYLKLRSNLSVPQTTTILQTYKLPWLMLHKQIRQTLFFSIHVQSINKSCQLSFQRSRQWHPTPVLLPGKFHGWRSLVGCSPWGREASDTTEWLHFHFSLSCIGEGNGTPLQYPCLENPVDGGAWWAAIYGVT